jgi:tetratricopeptide (TPR) repeat protein
VNISEDILRRLCWKAAADLVGDDVLWGQHYVTPELNQTSRLIGPHLLFLLESAQDHGTSFFKVFSFKRGASHRTYLENNYALITGFQYVKSVEKVAWALVNVHILDLGKALLDHALTLHLVNNQNEESVLTACIRAAIAYYYDVKQDLQTAEKMYSNAIEIVVSIHGSWKMKETIWIAVLKALMLFIQSKFDECEALCSEVLEGLKDIYGDADNHQRGNTQLILGRLFIRQGEFNKAISMLEQAQMVYRQLDDRVQLLTANSEMAYVYYSQGRYVEGLQLYKSCIKEWVAIYKTKKSIDVAIDLGSISNIYAALGQYRKAYLYARESLDLEMEITGTSLSPDMALGMVNMAEMMRLLGDVDGSLRVVEDVERILEKLGLMDSFQMGLGLVLKARGYCEKGIYVEALQYCSQGLSVLKEALGNESNRHYLNGLKVRGSIKKFLNQNTESRDDFELCLRTEVEYYKTRRNDRVAATLLEIGTLCRVEGRLDEALSHLQEARCGLEESVGDRDHHSKAITAYELGLVHIDMGNAAEAKIELDGAAAMMRRMFGDEHHPRLKLVMEALQNL